ncbi:hypothetical protein GII36_01465 [Candidatus Mycosynbacter amalyticus]|uniref:Lipoprotein n=1 Tax=Candidatus Mycosynbacter amalyticus TaxID=2665156 RepID=A0A857ML51_9BACT|nr:hypothetical protein [Candidatus Mycosynbacter amalyticus]QHN42515.1 hypothetical protein GII36_01465 [Candidatus Mycosynbacter amalyticus]
MKIRESWTGEHSKSQYGFVVSMAAACAITGACSGQNEVSASESLFDESCHTVWVTQGTSDPYTNIKVYPSDLQGDEGAEALKGRMQAFFMPDRTGSLENRERNLSPEVLDAFVVSVRHVMEASTTDRLPMVNALTYSDTGKAHSGAHSDDKMCAVNADRFPISSIYDFSSY